MLNLDAQLVRELENVFLQIPHKSREFVFDLVKSRVLKPKARRRRKTEETAPIAPKASARKRGRPKKQEALPLE